MQVVPIKNKTAYPFLLERHYAHRIPSISYAFGLVDNEELIGVITYGSPPSAPLRTGICGPDEAHRVLELNRLCLLYNRHNEASFLVGRSLRLLPDHKIVISFADTEQKHVGIVYQACNFIYCGLSAKRTDWKVKGKEHLHGQTIADEFRGTKDRAKAMRDKYGGDFYLAPRPRKHRYIYITGSGKLKLALSDKLRYNREPYPKQRTL